jgi:protein-disulfide isomerase
VLGQVFAEFGDRVRLVFKDFPLEFHEGARPAAEASRCAGAMGRFWEYHDLLFLAQPEFSRDQLVGYAARLGLDRSAFASCLDSGRFRAAVEADFAEGRARGVRGTPTFFVNGRRLVGAQPIEAFREAIRDALADAARK